MKINSPISSDSKEHKAIIRNRSSRPNSASPIKSNQRKNLNKSNFDHFELNHGRSEDKMEIKLFDGLNLLSTKEDDTKSNNVFDKHADEAYICKCSLCGLNNHQKDTNPYSFIHKFFNGNNSPSNPAFEGEKDFVFVLKRLFPPKNMSRTIRVLIPETVGFINGEVKFIIMTEKDKSLKFIKQRDKLSFYEIRKFFNERKKKKEDIHTLEDDPVIQFFSPGDAYSFKKKSILNTSPNQIDETLGNTKETAIVRFRDDSIQVLCESELNGLLRKQKADPLWKEVQYLQMFTRTRKVIHNLSRVYMVYEKEKDNPLFSRASNEILYLNGEIPQASEDYIPLIEEERFEEELKNSSEQTYCLYLLFKIVHFLDQVYSTKILRMAADFVKDDQDNFWLINISKIQYEILPNLSKNIDETHTSVYKDLEESATNENIKLFNENDEIIEYNNKRESAKLLHNLMKQQYEAIKKSKVEAMEVFYQDDISDEIFAQIHPNAPFKLSELLKSPISYNEITEILEKNCLTTISEGLTSVKSKNNSNLQNSTVSGMTHDKSTQKNNASIHKYPRHFSRHYSAQSHNNSPSRPELKKVRKTNEKPIQLKKTFSKINRQFSYGPDTQDFSKTGISNQQSGSIKGSPSKIQIKNVFRATQFSNGKKNVFESDSAAFLDSSFISQQKILKTDQEIQNQPKALIDNGSQIPTNPSSLKKKAVIPYFAFSEEEINLNNSEVSYQKNINASISSNKFIGFDLQNQSYSGTKNEKSLSNLPHKRSKITNPNKNILEMFQTSKIPENIRVNTRQYYPFHIKSTF